MELGEFEVAARRMANGYSDRSMVVTGLRGVGKTVLLQEFCSIAERINWTYQQIEAEADLDLPGVLADRVRTALLKLSAGQRVADRLRHVLGVLKSFRIRWNLPEGGGMEVGIEPFSHLANTGVLHEDLADLFTAVGEFARDRGVGVLITIDEIQYLKPEQMRPLVVGLHKVGQRQLPLMIVGAGLPSTIASVGEARSYAERLFTFLTINSLSPEHATAALTAPAAEHQISWDEEALVKVVEETAGYPYFLQEFGKQAWNFASGPSRITLMDVRHATPMAIEALDRGFFRVRFDRTTKAERSYLAAMASLGPGPHSTGDVASQMGKTTSQASTQRNQLIQKGLCYSPRHGQIAFTVPMFDRFVRRHLSL